ncbi:unnamed protein product [Adineta steineri]|uniref:Uncharacterized protein n=1 Tax=Adineta steineri TaxID=433720 RepID=A0A815S341_9BILA|nr:unnamed protein product [Adineta steineri]CAF1639432.1 unnamed protein product [Adineta steineri]
MSRQTRSLSELPEYYSKLTTKQQRNWRKNTRKIQYNESLREQYAPYRPSSNIIITHLHHQTSVETVETLIKQAKETKMFTVDTECQKGEREESGALVQIQFIHSVNESTIILVETNFLPAPQTTLFNKIKELCEIIFNNGNDIISWGPIKKEFKEFHHLNLIDIGKIVEYNLQFLFSNPNGKPITHPAREKRDEITRCSFIDDTPGDNESDDDYDDQPVQSTSGEPTSLQDAVATTFNKYLDKSLTLNYWKCGIDLKLNTWRTRLFSRNRYDEHIEKEERNEMAKYAINDCTSVAELFIHMYPEKFNNYSIPPAKNYINDLSDISDDEPIEMLRPKFNNKQHELIVTTTQQEMDEINQPEPQQPQEINQQQQQQQNTLTKQQKKNLKLKGKQQNLPQFQLKIKRPIYYRYDYRKIRSQLLDDKIYTSKQITIDRKYSEVVIGFKTQERFQYATKIMRINYFSKESYNNRW